MNDDMFMWLIQMLWQNEDILGITHGNMSSSSSFSLSELNSRQPFKLQECIPPPPINADNVLDLANHHASHLNHNTPPQIKTLNHATMFIHSTISRAILICCFLVFAGVRRRKVTTGLSGCCEEGTLNLCWFWFWFTGWWLARKVWQRRRYRSRVVSWLWLFCDFRFHDWGVKMKMKVSRFGLCGFGLGFVIHGA